MSFETAAMQLGLKLISITQQPTQWTALAPRTLHAGGRSAKRRRAADQEASHDAKRKRGMTIEMPSPAREEASHTSQSQSATPGHSSLAEDSLHASTHGYASTHDI